MPVTLQAFNTKGLYTFVDTDPGQEPNWPGLAIDPSSNSSAVTLKFSFENKAVEITFTGSFPDNVASLGTLSSVFSSNVSGYTLRMGGQQLKSYSFSTPTSLETVLALEHGTNQQLIASFYSGNDTFIGSTTVSTDENDWINGWGGNDTFYSNALTHSNWTDGFYGNDGLDTIVFNGNRANYQLARTTTTMGNTAYSVSGEGFRITDLGDAKAQATLLMSVERVRFADQALALDCSGTGNAGKTMEIIGLLAPAAINDLGLRKNVLDLFDSGKSMAQIAQLALDLGVVPSSSTALAQAVFQNVFSRAGDAGTIKAWSDYIDGHGAANSLAAAADLHLNVDLVGLASTGMAYAL